MKTTSLFFTTLLSLAFAPTAFADSAVDAEYSFEDELVPGDYQNPGGEVIFLTRDKGRTSLIQLRTEFVAPMLKSVEDL